MLTDKALTDLVNYVVFTAAAAQPPLDAKVYSVGEVSELRRRPLTELCLLVNHRAMAPAGTSNSPTRGRVKIPHMTAAGRGMITRFDAP